MAVRSHVILAVVAEEGATRIGPLGEVGRSVLRDRLFTPGVLLCFREIERRLSVARP